MKRLGIKHFIIVFVLITFISCKDKREPGRIYMPDMAYSRAYEAYAPNTLDPTSVNYRPYPVEGTIRRGDLLLVDLWAKLQKPNAVYADYTWMAYLGNNIPDRIQIVWETVKEARDAAVAPRPQ